MSSQGSPRPGTPLVHVLPLGPVEDRLLRIVAANLFSVYGWRARIESGLAVAASTLDNRRRQHDAANLLQQLEAYGQRFPRHKTLAVTAVDLFVPIFQYVFGEARQGGAAALVSVYRLAGATAEIRYERAVKVALHEFGHLLSLTHCPDARCLMHYAETAAGVDRIPLRFCRYCRAELRTLGPPGRQAR